MNPRDVSLAAILTLALTTAAHAQVSGKDFSDSFNNNLIDDQWNVVTDPDDIIQIDEANQHIEFIFNEPESGVGLALLASNDWWFDPTQPARFRIDFRFTPGTVPAGGEVGFLLGFTTSPLIVQGIVDDGVEFHYAVSDSGPFTGLRSFVDGQLVRSEDFMPSATDQATVYFTWDGDGLLCASFFGYGFQFDSICFNNLLPSQQIGDLEFAPPVILYLGAYALSPNPAIGPVNAWIDNFVIDEGTTRHIETPEPDPDEDPIDEEEEDPEPTLDDTGEDDADGDTRVDLDDLAIALRNRDAGPRIARILLASGFDPSKISSQKWTRLMTGLYTHRIAPKLFPRPTQEEKSRSIAALTAVDTGETGGSAPAADSGTPDANDDGIINLADIATMLEGPGATPDRLLEALLLIGIDPDSFPKKKDWKFAVKTLYEAGILSEFAGNRAKKQRKKDQKSLTNLF